MLDGWPHCPQTPTRLHEIIRPTHLSVGPPPSAKRHEPAAEAVEAWQKSRDELETFQTLIAERQQYAFSLHGRTSAGNPRFVCPSRAGKIVCHGCPMFPLGAPRDTGLAEVEAPPDLPQACAAATITVGPEVDEKRRQEHYWGSPSWIASANRRSRIEASFGMLKGWTTGALDRGWTLQVGLVRTSLLLAVAVAASNLRQLLAWARTTANTSDELTQIDVTAYGFEEYDQHGNLVGVPEPPPPTA